MTDRSSLALRICEKGKNCLDPCCPIVELIRELGDRRAARACEFRRDMSAAQRMSAQFFGIGYVYHRAGSYTVACRAQLGGLPGDLAGPITSVRGS